MTRLHMVPMTIDDFHIAMRLRITYFGLECDRMLDQLTIDGQCDADLMFLAQQHPQAIAVWRSESSMILFRGYPLGSGGI